MEDFDDTKKPCISHSDLIPLTGPTAVEYFPFTKNKNIANIFIFFSISNLILTKAAQRAKTTDKSRIKRTIRDPTAMPPSNPLNQECDCNDATYSFAHMKVVEDLYHPKHLELQEQQLQSQIQLQSQRQQPQQPELEIEEVPETEKEQKQEQNEHDDKENQHYEQRKQKNVSFDITKSVINIIPSLDEYSSDEIRSLWYTKTEFQVIKQSCYATIQLMKIGFYAENDRICFRGFECKQHNDVMRRRALDKIQAETAVLVEQERQEQSGTIKQPDLIADVYRSYTIRSKFDAFRMGLKDGQVAQEYYLNEGTTEAFDMNIAVGNNADETIEETD